MQTEKREGTQERRILIGLIADDMVLGHVASKWTKEGLFASRWANIIATWCVDYFAKYSKAPLNAIEGLFESWAEQTRDKDTAELVGTFLSSLSGEYEAMAANANTSYTMDQAGAHFNRVRLSKLAETLQGDLDSGDVSKALKRVESFSHVEVGKSQGVDVLSDFEAIKQAFRQKSDPIIQYPGALGTFFRDALERDSLISFMGPEKRGKTFWLLDIAWRAMQQGRRVAMFEVGDMSEAQIMLRFMARACRRPMKATEPGKPVKYPTLLDHAPDAKHATTEHSEHNYEEALTFKEARASCRKILGKQGSDKGLLRLSCHPNSSLTVQGLASIIQTWERQGWGSPDVVVIDYADVLSPSAGHSDTRDGINATWKQLRALSQSLHACVVTATQSDADSYTSETMTMGNFSEDKRKNAHVTGMVGINQTSEEKKMGIQRLNWLALRESEFTPDDVVHVAGCLAVANPAVLSTF